MKLGFCAEVERMISTRELGVEGGDLTKTTTK